MPDLPYSERLLELAEKWLQGTISEVEKKEFSDWYQQFDDQEQVLSGKQKPAQIKGDIFKAVNKKINSTPGETVFSLPQTEIQPLHETHNIHFLKTSWFRYAVAIIVMVVAGCYFWLNDQKAPAVAITKSKQIDIDLAPGREVAVLSLSDGTEIQLDNAATGRLAQQGNADIIKSTNGQIQYVAQRNNESGLVFNTMTTPRGGHYQLRLPDGTEVWLNSASSITYPVVFTGNERVVSIAGELYFEVAKDKSKPFRVHAGGMKTEVLGTHFNINSYSDEPSFKTTLLEGSIKVINDKTESILLKPGQQADMGVAQQLTLVKNPDVEQVMAWKNGLFEFNENSIETVMRQLARWYDVKINYLGDFQNRDFTGTFSRDSNLSEIIKILEFTGVVQFKINGRQITVSPR